ncbi:MAG: DUF1015 domain-containing protein [Bacteroidetes bacterium]|nr:MAG: DUF1015 domain-containing protein [Bacteroidota bacterium]
MATVRPFKAFRPTRDKVHLVASRSYISYSRKGLMSKLDENPFTFLHILNPEYNKRKTTKANSEARFLKVREKFREFITHQIIVQDEKDSFYIYRQIKNGHAYLGIIGCASVEDYHNKVIKKHEATIAKRENMFKNYLKSTQINAEPVCFTYPNNETIDLITQQKIIERPEYDFTTTNKDRHSFWVIDNPKEVQLIAEAFKEVDSIYIANGHHRSASFALMGEELKSKNPNHTGDELYNFFMGVFIPEQELQIFEFNRLITEIGDLTTAQFLKKIQKEFEVIYVDKEMFVPRKVHEIGMYIDNKWYCLIPKEGKIKASDPVENLDVSILTNHLLAPILGITDLRTDNRVYFKGGLAGVEALKHDVDSGKARAAFAHFPVTMDQLKKIADADCIMPPKSTWIEPKLRSGLTVFSTDENDR